VLAGSRIEPLEGLAVLRERAAKITGFAGLVFLLFGASLYAINSPYVAGRNALLSVGVVLLAAYVVLNLRAFRAMARTRSSRYGANTAVMVVFFACIIVIIQALSARHSLRLDLTRNQRFSLAEQTVNVARALQGDIELFGFYKQTDLEGDRAKDLFVELSHVSSRIRYELIDPDRDPARTQAMGVTEYGTVIVQYGERRETLTSVSEEALTNALLKVTRDTRKTIYFVIGHGEKDLASEEPGGYAILSKAIGNENYDVKTISLFDSPAVPEDCHLLVVAGPTVDYFDSEIAKITEYLSGGKNALFLIDPHLTFPLLEGLLSRYRVDLGRDVVIDPYSRLFGTEYTVPVVTQYVEHPITRGMDVATFYRLARSVRIDPEPIGGVTVQYLAQTGSSAWGETDLDRVKAGQAVRGDDDLQGPVSIALVAQKTYASAQPNAEDSRESQIVVFGDSDFADNSAFRASGNADLFLNVVNFLAEEKDLIAIRPKQGMGDRMLLTATEGRLLFLISVVLIPVSVMGFGISVFVKRRKLG
jgi:ABC-type uncharacterized transport system involved in gliding motility auxiliary subunit